MKIKLIASFFVLLLVLWTIIFYNHKKIEYSIESDIVMGKDLLFRDIFDSGDQICILPPYSDPSSIKSLIPIEDFEYLNSDINRFIYGWENAWFVVKIDKQKTPKVFRISGLTKPDFKKSQCMDFRKAKISLSSEGKSHIYFAFLEE